MLSYALEVDEAVQLLRSRDSLS